MEASLLNLQNIHIYQDKHLILKDVSLQVNAGDLIYLIGKTGTGKSSFLKALYADLPISEGEAQIVGFDLKQIKEELGFDLEYKRNLGYRCENENVLKTNFLDIDSSFCKVGYENELYIVINVFTYNGKTYCNCLDKRIKKLFLTVMK